MSASAGQRRGRRQARAPVKVQWGRLAVLGLVLLGLSFYFSPLRAFFAQQDRYAHEAALLAQAEAENKALRGQLALMRSDAYVKQRAREDFQLVPRGMQAFVVKGLPDDSPLEAVRSSDRVEVETPSLPARLIDLWRTLAN